MPTYEYECNECGDRHEEVQPITDPPIQTCPTCGKPALRRLVSGGSGFLLKGDGWARDMYASGKAATPK